MNRLLFSFCVAVLLFAAFVGSTLFRVGEQAKAEQPEQPEQAPPELELTKRYSGQTWSFAVADYNNDRVPDLWIIKRTGTGSGKLEIHILNGKDMKTWMKRSATPMYECPDEPVSPLPDTLEKP
jgi:hypothetical protein